MDALWPDLWPMKEDMPPADLFLGDVNSSLGRCCLARHPLMRVKSKRNEPLPSAIDMSYIDGHAAKIRLQDLKRPTWHVGYTPIGNPWKTTLINWFSAIPAPAGRCPASEKGLAPDAAITSWVPHNASRFSPGPCDPAA